MAAGAVARAVANASETSEIFFINPSKDCPRGHLFRLKTYRLTVKKAQMLKIV
jgi:hypothetical protein